MRNTAACFLLIFLFAAMDNNALGQSHLTRDKHKWGKFGLGTWIQTTERSESIDDKTGKVESVSVVETKSKLIAVEGNTFSLSKLIKSDVGGTVFSKKVDRETRNFFGQPTSANIEVKQLKDEKITVAKKEITCKVQQTTLTWEKNKLVIVDYYNEKHKPYLLKRVKKTFDPDKKEKEVVISESTIELLALEMPVRVQNELKNCTYLQQTYKNHKATKITVAVYCPDVPGEVVSSSTKELDSKGKLIRRSAFELNNYEVVKPKQPEKSKKPGLLERIRNKRDKRRGTDKS